MRKVEIGQKMYGVQVNPARVLVYTVIAKTPRTFTLRFDKTGYEFKGQHDYWICKTISRAVECCLRNICRDGARWSDLSRDIYIKRNFEDRPWTDVADDFVQLSRLVAKLKKHGLMAVSK